TLTIVDSPTVTLAKRTLPIYKLLGNMRDKRPPNSLVLNQAEYVTRRTTWRLTLKTLPENLRDAPLFFFGTETSLPKVQDFLAEVFSLGPPFPSKIVFLRGDTTQTDPTVKALISKNSSLGLIDSSLKDLCEALASFTPSRAFSGFDTTASHPNLAVSW